MENEKKIEVMKRALATFGEPAQVVKAIEELGELSVELARLLNAVGTDRYQTILLNVSWEMADAVIMIEQLKICFDIDLEHFITLKLLRLENRLDNVAVK